MLYPARPGSKVGSTIRTRVYEWEEEEEYNLKALLEQQVIEETEEDQRTWMQGKEKFRVRSIYNLLQEGFTINQQTQIRNFPAKKVWNNKTPSKINFFIWASLRGRTLTSDNLRMQRKTMPNRCIMCKLEEESIQHLFIGCKFAEGI